MRPVVFVSLFAIAAMAIPIAHEIFGTKHLTKRNSNAGPTIDFLLATLLTFGGFVWGGGIITKRAINYYFNKKVLYDEERLKKNMMAEARVKKIGIKPQSMESRLIDEVYLPL